ncbi:mediator of RNA polymerase II transcription subunit 1.1 [Nematostella vectensis]|uniref:mediator of RNA polymerase II transcription subunit 1.1 n=1 Tax=Nematostella vectensis TaxID=45351 RepID=UPI0020774D9E|nr:mediator of RNA polymerase II transcription subunit 1.1 [Nematostella vectensis]
MYSPCCVPYCRSRAAQAKNFHPFPKNAERKRQWLHIISEGAGEVEFTKKSRVCWKHFTDSDYKEVRDSRGRLVQDRVLRDDACPRVFSSSRKKRERDTVRSQASGKMEDNKGSQPKRKRPNEKRKNANKEKLVINVEDEHKPSGDEGNSSPAETNASQETLTTENETREEVDEKIKEKATTGGGAESTLAAKQPPFQPTTENKEEVDDVGGEKGKTSEPELAKEAESGVNNTETPTPHHLVALAQKAEPQIGTPSFQSIVELGEDEWTERLVV